MTLGEILGTSVRQRRTNVDDCRFIPANAAGLVIGSLPLFSQQKNIPYDTDQENDPKQKNHASHLEIRVTKDTLFLAHSLQYPGILNDHDK